MKRIFVISGLPRSGSTLLCNVLAQNPRFHATHTSGCLEVLLSIRNNWDKFIEHQAHHDWPALQRVLSAALHAYHSTDRPVVFDKSRGWLAYLELLEHVLQEPVKVIVPVRPVVDVLASFEKLYRSTARYHQVPGENEHYFRFQTVEGRCDYLLESQNVVGLAYTRVRDALQRGFGDRMLFVDFAALTQAPHRQIETIYDFLREPHFSHDFGRVTQVTTEDDHVHGFYGMHRIRETITPARSDAAEVLGKALAQKYSGVPSFW